MQIDKSIAILGDLPTGFSSQVAQEIEQATNLPWQRNAGAAELRYDSLSRAKAQRRKERHKESFL